MKVTHVDSARSRLHEIIDIADSVVRESTRIPRQSKEAWRGHLSEIRTMIAADRTTLAAIRQLEVAILTPFQEGVGEVVERFWERVAQANLPPRRRRDVVKETLRSGKVRNMHEYAALEDHFEELQTINKISAVEADRLNSLLDAFAEHPTNRWQFDSEE